MSRLLKCRRISQLKILGRQAPTQQDPCATACLSHVNEKTKEVFGRSSINKHLRLLILCMAG